MDTNVKKFKYSNLKKIICIIICFAAFLTATGLAGAVIMSLDYCRDGIPADFTESNNLKFALQSTVAEAVQNSANQGVGEEVEKELEQYRQEAVENIYKQFINLKNNTDDTYDYYENLDTYVKTSQKTLTFKFIPADIVCNYKSWEDLGEKEIKSIINESYDDFILSTASDSYYTYVYGYNQGMSISYNAEINSYNSMNIKNSDKSNIIDQDYYLVYNNGEVTSKGISDKTVSYIVSNIERDLQNYGTDFLIENAVVQAGFDLPFEKIENPTVHDYFDKYTAIQAIKNFHPILIEIYNDVIIYFICAVIALIISFAAAFSYFNVTGRKDEKTPSRLVFIDRVPFEIHLAGAIAIVFPLSVLFNESQFYLGEFMLYGRPLLAAIIVYSALLWTLVFEFCSSVARYAKSDKKFYKNFFVYQLAVFLIFISKKLVRLDIKMLKAISGKLKKVFGILSYTPKKFAQNVILIAMLYVFANLTVLGIIVLLIGGYMGIFGVFLALVDLGVNIYLFIKFLDYIRKLDMIITASANHEDAAMDINTLPQSLKTLAESMCYTNTELQNAVAQAVKDERLRTELITNVSHDLKTPLTSIITYVDLLSKCDINDEKAQEYIKVLDNKGAKLKRLIDDLIEASKVTSGNITVNASNINLYELCLQACIEAQNDFGKAGLELIIKENNAAPIIFADGQKAFRVVENLLSNARKYSAKASRVYVSVYKQNDLGVFEIKNVSAQPLDISPEELTQRFVRGDKSRNQEGNGLGLSIAKELCRVQNGDLEITIDGDLFKVKVKLPLAE